MQQQSGLIFELIKIFNIIISTLLIELDNRGSMFKTVKHMKQPNATWLGALFMWTTRSHLVLDNSLKEEKKQKEHKNNIYFLEQKQNSTYDVSLYGCSFYIPPSKESHSHFAFLYLSIHLHFSLSFFFFFFL
jgi:hypothetical protein